MKSNSYKVKRKAKKFRCSECHTLCEGKFSYIGTKKICRDCFYNAKLKHKRKFR